MDRRHDEELRTRGEDDRERDGQIPAASVLKNVNEQDKERCRRGVHNTENIRARLAAEERDHEADDEESLRAEDVSRPGHPERKDDVDERSHDERDEHDRRDDIYDEMLVEFSFVHVDPLDEHGLARGDRPHRIDDRGLAERAFSLIVREFDSAVYAV